MALDANPMTGLPGNNSIAAAIAKAIDESQPLGIIYTDLDNFKAFNDKYGFALGNEIIKFTAELLAKSLKVKDSSRSFLDHF
jgi:diguanylate cyclase (GGDEF)-like protein